MRNSAIPIILFIAFLASCQTRAENLVTNSAENLAQIKPLISPTPTSSLTPKQKETFNIHSKVGIVDVLSDQPSCLRTKNGDLAEKTPVSIIVSLDEPPQKVLTTVVEKKLEKSCARRASETGDKSLGENYFYSLILTDTTAEELSFDVGIAVIQPTKPIQVQNNLASIDLDKDGKTEFFRSCMGFEGIHFTIWTGEPLKGKRIWQSFYYLDYDTEPNCKKRDWQEIGN